MITDKLMPFGEWLPDLPPLMNPGALEAKNCIPTLKSYRSLNALSSFTNALASEALGAFWLQISDNTVFNFCGDASALYRLDANNTTWTDISIGGGYTSVSNWDFAKFGDQVIAVDKAHAPQVYTAGVDSAFSALGGSPPQAARIAVIRDFVVLGDIEGAGRGPNFVQWSGFNSSVNWAPSKSTQSDFQELFGRGGRVQKIVPGEYGVIFQEHAIHRMDYVGPPVIFQFDEVERGRGTPAPNSVIWTGNLVFYYGHDGFYLFNGQSSEPIGVDRVNSWFSEHADVTSLESMRGAIDRRNRLAMWGFKSSASQPHNDMLIIFNWASNKWSYAETATQLLSEYVTSGLTLDDPAFDALYGGGIDAGNDVSFDSDTYKGGALSLQAFNSSNQSATFDGAPLTATIDTGEMGNISGRADVITGIRPIIEGTPGTSITCQVGTRDSANNNVNFTTARPLNSIGEANIRKSGRFQRFRVNVSGGFSHAHGVQPEMQRGGRR